MNVQIPGAFTWGGQAAFVSKGNLHELVEKIPSFKRLLFSLGGLSNKYYDLIVRPEPADQPPVQVVLSRKFKRQWPLEVIGG